MILLPIHQIRKLIHHLMNAANAARRLMKRISLLPTFSFQTSVLFMTEKQNMAFPVCGDFAKSAKMYTGLCYIS